MNGLSLDVAPGEILGLIGPNGAGKTSTLRCIAGIHRPPSGTVSIDGHDIVREPFRAKRLLAFVADEPHLFEHLTVMEHLRLTGRIYGVADVETTRARIARGCGAGGAREVTARGTVARDEAEGRARLRLPARPERH